MMRGLILDDDGEVGQYIASVMEEMGIEAVVFQDPIVALDHIKGDSFQVAFIDINLPRMDGLRFGDLFKNTFPDADVVFVTGYGDYDKAVRAIKLGTYDFLKKPFRRLDIRMCLTRLMEKRALYENQKKMQLLEFSNDVALQLMHEIRNPLVALGGFARMLSRKEMGENKLKEISTIIYDAAVRLENVLKKILKYLKNGPQPTDPTRNTARSRGLPANRGKPADQTDSGFPVYFHDGPYSDEKNMQETITEPIKGGETMSKKKKGVVEKKLSTTQAFDQAREINAGINKEYLSTQKMCRVTFKLPQTAAPDAKSVNIVGDFNNWDMNTHPMEKNQDGDFTINLELSPGKEYQFRYLIDGLRWENDWYADRYERSPFGDSDNSVVST